MIQTLPIFQKKVLNEGYNQTQQSKKTAASLHSFLQKTRPSATPLNIISVHGDEILDRQIASHAPEGAEFFRIRSDLRKYLSKPRFDMILFSLSGRKYGNQELYEELSYCRMLLKPGGSIWFSLEESRGSGLLQKFLWKKSMEAAWLTRTGFAQIQRKKIGRKAIFLCGTRPGSCCKHSL